LIFEAAMGFGPFNGRLEHLDQFLSLCRESKAQLGDG